MTLRPQEDEDMWHAYNLIQEVRPACAQPPREPPPLTSRTTFRETGFALRLSGTARLQPQTAPRDLPDRPVCTAPQPRAV